MRQILKYLIVPVLLSFVSGARAETAMVSCAEDNRIVAGCYHVQGRLSIHANMRPYLHLDGTKRILGIVERGSDTGYFWPVNVENEIDLDRDLMGDFYVCPFTPDEPRKMRFVCIENYKKR